MKTRTEQMSLEELIGQMLMVGFHGQELDTQTALHLTRLQPGGIIYFARNLADAAQAEVLSERLQDLAHRTGTRQPYFIAIDQEGGTVSRISRGVTPFPGNMALGATGSPDLAYQAGAVTGAELRRIGINLNLAPVLDVNNNPDNPVIGLRSFGEDPYSVTRLGKAMIQGLQDAGVLATAKHFPGHGDTAVDSHLALAAVPHPRSRLDQVELRPFKEAIRSKVGAVMTAHLAFPAIEPDPRIPATLSKLCLTDLLRDELGFQGIIMTDCMQMRAIADHFGTEEAAIMTVEAGADIVLVSHDPHVQERTLHTLLQAVQTGRLTRTRLEASVERILRAKKDLGITETPHQAAPSSPAPEVPTRIAERSITLVRDLRRLLPLAEGPLMVIDVLGGARTLAEDALLGQSTLAEALRSTHPQLDAITISPDPDPEEIQILAKRAPGRVVITTWDAHLHPGQAQLIKELREYGNEIIALGVRLPYELRVLDGLSTYLAVYSNHPSSLDAAARILTGQIPPQGQLPVSIPGLYPLGHRG